MKNPSTALPASRIARALTAFLIFVSVAPSHADDCAGNLLVSCEPSVSIPCGDCENSPNADEDIVYVIPFGGCAWNAVPTVPWIHISTVDTSSVPHTFTFTTDANTNALPRTGYIAVSGASFKVVQGGTSTLASGRVTTAGGTGVSGVTINFGDVPPATTDANGFWQQTGFPTCNFALATPQKSGYTFSPGWRSVSSGQTNRNFTAIP